MTIYRKPHVSFSVFSNNLTQKQKKIRGLMSLMSYGIAADLFFFFKTWIDSKSYSTFVYISLSIYEDNVRFRQN